MTSHCYLLLQVTWFVYQATRMVWKVNDDGVWAVEPDQMTWVSLVTLCLCVPLVEWILYPLLRRCRWLCLNTVPKRAVLGAILAIIAFVLAARLQLMVEATWEDLPTPRSKRGDLMICSTLFKEFVNVTTDIEEYEFQHVGGYDAIRLKNIRVDGTRDARVHIVSNYSGDVYVNQSVRLVEGKIVGVMASYGGGVEDLLDDLPVQTLWRCDLQLPRVAIVYRTFTHLTVNQTLTESLHPAAPNSVITVKEVDGVGPDRRIFLDPNHVGQYPRHFRPNNHIVKSELLDEDDYYCRYRNLLKLRRGGVYLLFNIWRDDGCYMMGAPGYSGGYRRNLSVVFPPNYLHMSRQVPQYLLLSLAHYLLPLCMLEYSFMQISPRMKPVALILWYWTAALGNILAAIIAWPAVILIGRDFWVYVLFSILMAVDLLWLLCVVLRHKPAALLEDNGEEEKTGDTLEEEEEEDGEKGRGRGER